MSYAGTYGADETCPHDSYWRSCRYCSGIGPRPTPVQITQARLDQALRKAHYLAHPSDVRKIVPEERTIVVYDARCPNPACEWKRSGVSLPEIEDALRVHLEGAERVAHEWAGVNPDDAWVDP